MKKIIILSLVALLIRFILIIYYIPIFEKSDISQNLDKLKVHNFLIKINDQRPFQSNVDTQYYNKKDLNNKFVKKSYDKRSIRMNDDEEQNFAIAVNFLNGNNYSIFDQEKKNIITHHVNILFKCLFINILLIKKLILITLFFYIFL